MGRRRTRPFGPKRRPSQWAKEVGRLVKSGMTLGQASKQLARKYPSKRSSSRRKRVYRKKVRR